MLRSRRSAWCGAVLALAVSLLSTGSATAGGGGNPHVQHGTAGADTLTRSSRRDILLAHGGDDRMLGLGGDDRCSAARG